MPSENFNFHFCRSSKLFKSIFYTNFSDILLVFYIRQVVNFCIPFPSILSNITRKKKRKKSVKGKELQGKEKTGVDKRKGSRQKEGKHLS